MRQIQKEGPFSLVFLEPMLCTWRELRRSHLFYCTWIRGRVRGRVRRRVRFRFRGRIRGRVRGRGRRRARVRVRVRVVVRVRDRG